MKSKRVRPGRSKYGPLPTLYGRGCQYTLDLKDARRRVWNGESARLLTKAAEVISFEARPPWGPRPNATVRKAEDQSDGQLDLFLLASGGL